MAEVEEDVCSVFFSPAPVNILLTSLVCAVIRPSARHSARFFFFLF